MHVILMEDINKLGKMGDLIKVKDGYARNYLVPKKLALEATKRNMKELEHKKRMVDDKRKRDLASATDISTRISNLQITIGAKVGEEDKLFGSVTSRNIKDALDKEGVEIDKKNIMLEEPIKTVGVFDVDIKVHPEVIAKLRVWVVKE